MRKSILFFVVLIVALVCFAQRGTPRSLNVAVFNQDMSAIPASDHPNMTFTATMAGDPVTLTETSVGCGFISIGGNTYAGMNLGLFQNQWVMGGEVTVTVTRSTPAGAGTQVVVIPDATGNTIWWGRPGAYPGAPIVLAEAAYLNITSTPAGAAVLRNGENIGEITPCSINNQVGLYEVFLDGYSWQPPSFLVEDPYSTYNIHFEGSSQSIVQDSLALIAIYNSTGGPNWTNNTNWLGNEPVNTWYGVTVSNGRVTELSLSVNNLAGTIPPEISNLTGLSLLDLGDNNLYGNIPAELYSLSNLQVLVLDDNALSGSLLPELGNLSNLTVLLLNQNSLTGIIPSSISNLTNLTWLFLGTNQLTGPVPASIGNLVNLTILDLNNNLLSGTIPVEIGNLSSLNQLSLSVNQLIGQVPSSLWNLSNLTHLSLGSNSLDGPIPASINNLSQLQLLHISYNFFNELPSLDGLDALQTLSIRDNYFTFEDIEPNLNVASVNFYYNPQRSVYETVDVTIMQDLPYHFISTIGGTQNFYQWYKDGTPYGTEAQFTIDNLQLSDIGTYTCNISSSLVPDLVIQRNPINLNVYPTPLIVQDSLALIALYNATGGPNWVYNTNWLSNEPVSTWYGVTVSEGRVTQLNLYQNGLNGYIPAAIGGLTALTSLIISNGDTTIPSANVISGSIPPEIGNLSALVHLDLHWLGLSGTVPMELWGLTNLMHLNLGGNNLQIVFPASLSTLSNLNSLNLGSSIINSGFPTQLLSLDELSELVLGNCQISGVLPVGIGNLVNLTRLDLSLNQLSGTIPASIGNLSALYDLSLAANQLTGNIPTEIWGMTGLTRLWLRNNQLTGEIPATIGNLDNLQYLEIDGNSFGGTIPPEIGNLTSLIWLGLSQNQLTGTIPQALGNLTNLQCLNLGTNNLSGPIPASLWNLTNLTQLWLNNNQFSGSIPASIGNLTNLTWLSLRSNSFNGSIPQEIGNLINLQYLDLSFNQLSGSIPPLIWNQTYLRYLYFSHNQLSGTIPTELSNLINLSILELDGNQLSGSIPPEIGTLINLQYIYLGENQLSGQVPTSLNNLSQLKSLFIEDNYLIDLPAFTGLDSLEVFHTHNNNFTFEDIEPNLDIASVQNSYYPQRNVLDSLDVSIMENLSYAFDSSIGGTQNIYQWYKDGSPYGTEAQFTIDNLQLSDSGTYTCNISSSLVPDLVIQRNPITLDVYPTPLIVQDSLALIAFYNATGGPNWTNNTNWLSNEPLSTWHGVTVSEGRVTQLSLSHNNLVGAIPSEIGNLTNLTYLSLSNNQLNGTIPAEIGSMSNLEQLVLHFNQLSGIIPSNIGNMTMLNTLSLGSNLLIGQIPNSIGSLTNLELLWIYNNQLDGIIPAELGSVMNLRQLSLTRNNLTGSIPSELGQLQNLEGLDISFNQLSGNIPPQIGNLTSLSDLNLSYNQLTGSIPSEIGNLTNLVQLSLSGNQLTGIIPQSIYSLTNLMGLELSSNQLTGSIQPSIGNLTNLSGLRLNNNQLSGPIPNELWGLSNLQVLTLSTNQLNGSIPSEIGNLINLSYLNLSSNQLNGSIPSQLWNMTNLTFLSLEWNQLSGSIPPEIGNLTNLSTLWLSSNQLSGSIPQQIGSMISLTSLTLNDNQLSGSIPPEIGNLTNLIHLHLDGNQLTSSIPSELANLTNLQNLGLSHNQFGGSIPPEIGNLTNLQYVWLGENQLSGQVPASINNLIQLKYLYLYGNYLDDLPIFTALDSLLEFQIYNNNFTFEDIEPNLDIASINNIYSPQRNVFETLNITIMQDMPYQFISTIGGTQNVYQWYKDGTPYSTEAQFTIPNLQLSDSGVYTCSISSSLVPGLVIQRNPITLNVVAVNHPPEIDLPASLDIPQNEISNFDFSPYVSDPDGDQLTLGVSGNQQIGVQIDGFNVSFSPAVNWIGSETLTFTVDDGVIDLQLGSTAAGWGTRSQSRLSDSDQIIINVINPLQFSFTASNPYNNNLVAGAASTAVQFSVSSNIPLSSWAWDFDDDGVVDSTEPSPSWYYDQPGWKSVTLEASDGIHVNWFTRENYLLVLPGVLAAGVVEENLVWTEAGGPYNIVGELLLSPLASLSIMPNAQVNLLVDSLLVINGTITAQGADFTSYSQQGWGGMVINASSQNSLLSGITINGATRGITINGCNPVLQNIYLEAATTRARGDTAILINGTANPQISGLWTTGFATGIAAANSSGSSVNLSFNNLRLERDTITGADTDTGIGVSGAYSLMLDNCVIEDYHQGVRLEGTDFSRAQARITNTRIRRTESSNRQSSTGFFVSGIASVIAHTDSITGYSKAIRISGATAQNTAVAFSGIHISKAALPLPGDTAIQLSGMLGGTIDSLEIQNYRTAYQLSGQQALQLRHSSITNCSTALEADSNPLLLTISHNVIHRNSLFGGDSLLPAFRLDNCAAAEFVNNSLSGYPLYLQAQGCDAINLCQNIFWHPNPVAQPISLSGGGTVAASFNDIALPSGIYSGEANINADPLYENPELGNFYLDVYSPCIDAGNPAYPPDPDGSVPDMGAVPFDQNNMPLIADFHIDQSSGSHPFPVQFSNHSTFNAIHWDWDFNGDSITDSNAQNPLWTFPSPGVYSVGLTVSDGVRFASKFCPELITVSNSTPLLIEPMPDLELAEDFASVEISLADYFSDPNGDLLSYALEYAEGVLTAQLQGNQLLLSSLQDIHGAVQITVIAEDGLQKGRTMVSRRAIASDSFLVTVVPVNDPPQIISFAPVDTVLVVAVGENVAFSVQAQDVDSELSYRWYVNNQLQSVQLPDFSYLYAEGGNCAIKLIVDDGDGAVRELNWQISEEQIMPVITALLPNYPNPFALSTTISYAIKEQCQVSIAIYNLRGQFVCQLISEEHQPGYHNLGWDGRDKRGNTVSTGVYIAELRAGANRFRTKMLKVR